MKICCLIDSLNSGGAQRQMTWLIRSLVDNGHEVRLLTYYEFDHYRKAVTDCGVVPENINTGTKVGRFWKFRSEIRKQRPDVIISFLDTPNFIGLFASSVPNRIPIVVSERNHDIAGVTRANRLRFNAFRMATKVVANCYSQSDFISHHFPFLKTKLSTILNCVDLGKFKPAVKIADSSESVPRNLIVAASVIPRKNAHNLIRGLGIALANGGNVAVDWFGNNLFDGAGNATPESQHYLESLILLKDLKLNDHFRFHNPVVNIETEFPKFDASCLPSFQEGCPNVVCEAMASGLPLLVSDHGDMKRMVGHANGFVFDPSSPESIGEAIVNFAQLSESERKVLGANSRKFAEEKLSPKRFAAEYEALIQEIGG